MVNPITLPQLSRVKAVPAKTDALVVALTGDDDKTEVRLPSGLAKSFEKKFGSSAAAVVAELGGKPKPGSVTLLPGVNGPRLVVVGLGSDAPTPATLRTAAGAAARVVSGLSDVRRVAVALPADEPELLKAVVEGTLLGQYSYAGVKAEPKEKNAPEFSIVSTVADNHIVDDARAITAAQVVAREWVNLPPTCSIPTRSPRPRSSSWPTARSAWRSSPRKSSNATVMAGSWRWAAVRRGCRDSSAFRTPRRARRPTWCLSARD